MFQWSLTLRFYNWSTSHSHQIQNAPKKMYFIKIIEQYENAYLKEYLYQVSKRLKSQDSYPNALNFVITVIKLSYGITKMLTVYWSDQ
jgi:hypothetical protein